MSEIHGQFGRVKGAEWFPLLHGKDIMVLGQGGIGSWASLLLSRIGCSLHIYDMDLYEEHNMTGQLVSQGSVGKNKAVAMKDILKDLSPGAVVEAYTEKYASTSPTNDIVICGFDNMEARKAAFSNWKEFLKAVCGPEERKQSFFQDGRLLAEQLQIFNIPGDRQDLIDQYEKEHLFNDSDVAEADCTFKQTSHCAAMIASHMVGFLTNWISNANSPIPFKPVPFFYQYVIPLNLVG